MRAGVVPENIKMSGEGGGFLGVKTFGMADINCVDINCEADIFWARKNVQGVGGKNNSQKPECPRTLILKAP